ncbi:terminase [Xanthomonas campestris]|uniref:terminase n=1 Tax=Xanthomonas campestris TaxID=339 RepID=UPI00137B30CC|nr:terminase [Xanthomonas campestris]
MLAKKGCTDPEVAEFFQVAVSTISLWKLKHPEFSDALKLGKAEADERVERALFERATGYVHPETHVSNYQGIVTLTPLLKHYAPDPTSMIFWLKNRQPEKWRDKPEGSDDETPTPPSVVVNVVSGRKLADA